MRPMRQIPRPQFVFNAPATAHAPFCGLCGNDVKVGPDGVRRHLAEDGSGELDEEMDRDHRPKPEDYHDEE